MNGFGSGAGLPVFRFPFVLTETVVSCNTRYMKQPSISRREVLLDAIIEYMLKHGVADLSLRPLAAKVGSKARLLIYHFRSKDSLVSEAMIVVRDRVQKAFAAMVENGRNHTASQILRAFWRWATSKQHERYLRLFFEVHGLALQKPARYGRYLEGAVSTWVEMMAAVLPASISLPKRRALATLAVSSVVGLFLDYLSSGDKKRSSQALEIFAVNFDELLLKEA
jgi:AcrR family transcriptional regulator